MTSEQFFKSPILNSPYECPSRHWELDADGQPTGLVAEKRRQADFISAVPQPQQLVCGEHAGPTAHGR
ncbi:MAG: hypothetical protein OXF03_08380 [Gammaproteobacteria bacterium]|nr:hypothetical protein [Gammaproteobacteria bacterium]MCY4255983.1 hypothetical protein [Gammaproteobacteria bacterium]